MATTVTRNVTIVSQGANGQSINSTYTLTGNNENNFLASVAIGTNTEFAIEFPYAAVQCVDIVSTVNMTLKFNSTSEPVPEITLTAGIPLHWDVAEYANDSTVFPNPFTSNITAVYCTNTVAGALQISVLLSV